MNRTRREWHQGSQERQEFQGKSHQTVKCCRGQARKGLRRVPWEQFKSPVDVG